MRRTALEVNTGPLGKPDVCIQELQFLLWKLSLAKNLVITLGNDGTRVFLKFPLSDLLCKLRARGSLSCLQRFPELSKSSHVLGLDLNKPDNQKQFYECSAQGMWWSVGVGGGPNCGVGGKGSQQSTAHMHEVE